MDSRKKWKNLEKRVADLEVRVQNQPKEIVEMLMKKIEEVENERGKQMTKASPHHQWKK